MSEETRGFWDEEPQVKTRQRHDNQQVEDILSGPNALSVQGGGPELAGPAAVIAAVLPLAEGKSRDPNKLRAAARRVGEMMGPRALYSFPAGRSRIEGATVHLIEALAGEYGYVWSGVTLDRQVGRKVFFTAMVIDIITGNVTSRPFTYTLSPPPGKFAQKPDQAARWEAMGFQSATSKAVRTCLEHALPDWMIQEAKAAAKDVMMNGEEYLGNQTLKQAVDGALEAWAELNVNQEHLEDYLGAAMATWTVTDIVNLRDLYRQIKSGERAVAAVFVDIVTGDGPPPPADDGSLAGRKAASQTSEDPPPKQQEDPAPAATDPASQSSGSRPATSPPDPESRLPTPAALRDRHGCPVCGKSTTLKRDGTMWQHNGEDGEVCSGSGQKPPADEQPPTAKQSTSLGGKSPDEFNNPTPDAGDDPFGEDPFGGGGPG